METTMQANQPLPYNQEDSRKFYVFIFLAMTLAVITGVEIVIVWIPIANWIQLWTLAILSIVKFLAVVWWFMHMRWDRALIAVVFFLGLFIAGGTVTVLWAIFHYDTNAPVWEEQQVLLQPSEGGGTAGIHSAVGIDDWSQRV